MKDTHMNKRIDNDDSVKYSGNRRMTDEQVSPISNQYMNNSDNISVINPDVSTSSKFNDLSDSYSLRMYDDNVPDFVRNNPRLLSEYNDLRNNKQWFNRFMDFIDGKKTLPVLYDPFFKNLFDGDIHRERLSKLVSSILGQRVEVIGILPNESSDFRGVFLIMDIIVRLSDGSLANIEVQKVPYFFPGQRLSCYSADILMRQYHYLNGQKEHDFSYKDLRKVHTIVFFEKSDASLISEADKKQYFHVGRTTFNTGIKMELLQEYHLISLDTFRKYRYSDIIKGNVEITEYDFANSVYKYPIEENIVLDRIKFLSLFCVDSVEEIKQLIRVFPELIDIFADMNEYLQRPEEVLGMFSKALQILDKNSADLMIDELEEKLEEQGKQLEEKDKQMEEKDKQMEEQGKQLEEQGKQLEEKDKQLEEKDKQLEDKDNEIAWLKAELEKSHGN